MPRKNGMIKMIAFCSGQLIKCASIYFIFQNSSISSGNLLIQITFHHDIGHTSRVIRPLILETNLTAYANHQNGIFNCHTSPWNDPFAWFCKSLRPDRNNLAYQSYIKTNRLFMVSCSFSISHFNIIYKIG